MILPASEGIIYLLLFLVLSLGIISFNWLFQVQAQFIEPPDTNTNAVTSLNLLGGEYDWQPVNKMDIERSPSSMNLSVNTSQTGEIYHRARMQDNITGIPMYLNLSYASSSSEGEAIYGISIRDLLNSKIFWSRLNDTAGQTLNQRVFIPENAYFGNYENRAQNLQFWLTIITDRPGSHYVNFSDLQLAVSPNYISLADAMPWLFSFR
jgi:hypothetical protein